MTTTPEDRWRPVLPLTVIPRPQGVFWAKVPDRHTLDGLRYAVGALCHHPEHPVYLAVRPVHATRPGCQGNERARTFFVCAECSPPSEERNV